MTLDAHEFIRRFVLHVVPDGFHRIRHYGLFANGHRAENIAKARALLGVTSSVVGDAVSANEAAPPTSAEAPEPKRCTACGGRMILVEIFERGSTPRTWRCREAPQPADTS